MLKRKAYDRLLEWKNQDNKKALCIVGARQVGKTTLIMEFARENYENFIEINFYEEPDAVKIFSGNLDAETIITNLTAYTRKPMEAHKTLVLFDEIQKYPNIRTAMKFLVADGRFDYIESGSLLGVSFREVVSFPVGFEEMYRMYPMDFEEFLWAIGDEVSTGTIKMLMEKKRPAGNSVHRSLMRTFRLYMLIGGMPQAIETYLEQNNLQAVEEIKRDIVVLCEEKKKKIDPSGLAGDIYDAIPANLSGNASRYVLSSAREGTRSGQVRDLLPDMLSSYTVNIAYHANNPGVGMALEKDAGRYKLFTSDVGLFVTLAFRDKNYTENTIYNKLLSDKLEANLGYVYENVVAQMLVAKGNNLFYYTMESDTSNHLYEIDFLTSVGNKICPIEVKSGNYRGHKSLDVFCDKFRSRICEKYVVHTKDYKRENGISYIPVYMVPFL